MVISGIVALALSLLLWRLTESVYAWAILAIPGGILTIYGSVMLFLGHD